MTTPERIAVIHRSLQVLIPEGELVEIRAIGTEGGRKGIRSGFYSDLEAAARDAWSMSMTYKAAGVYYTLNELKPALLERSPNVSRAGTSGLASDVDVAARRWLLIDIEGERTDKARNNATQAEVDAALGLADIMQARIEADTQARPARVMSGNGCHLLYRVDLPNTTEVLAAVKGFLKGLGEEFDCPEATVDCTVCNASRISKLPGTLVRKAKNLEDRPHRFAEMLSADWHGLLTLDYLLSWAPAKTAPLQIDHNAFQGPRIDAPTMNRPADLERARAWLDKRDHAIDGSHGDEWTLTTAGHLVRGFSLPDNQALDLMLSWNARCQPPWEQSDLVKFIANAHKYGTQPYGEHLDKEPSEKSAAHKKPSDYAQTDLGNAEYLRDHYGNLLRWCTATETWFVWDNRRWAEDKMLNALGLANKVARERKAACREIEDKETRKYEYQHAIKSESASKRDACLSQYKALHGSCIDIETLDSNAWQLNCWNGVLDLQKGSLEKHNPASGLSRLAPCSYEPDAKCPIWEAYLDKVMGGDQELIDYLRRAIGYTLTGSIREAALFVLWGDGSNGKSIFLETLGAILGDYSAMASTDAFLAKKSNGGPNPEIAMLRGVRFIRSSETPSNGRFDEVTIKQLTGGDIVTARQLYGSFFQFRPVGKIWIATNHKPEVRGGDFGIWRRLQLIPFTVKIPKEEQDHRLAEKLKAEWPGILAWAVRGCLEWQQGGIQPPAAVLAATEDYRRESDVLDSFIEDCCTVMPPSFWEETAKLYTAYSEWCKTNGERCLTSSWFGRRLGSKGYQVTFVGAARKRAWCGIRVGKFDCAVETQMAAAEAAIGDVI